MVVKFPVYLLHQTDMFSLIHQLCFSSVEVLFIITFILYLKLKLPLRTRSRKERRESSESDFRTDRDRQEVSAVTAAREADSIFSLAV